MYSGNGYGKILYFSPLAHHLNHIPALGKGHLPAVLLSGIVNDKHLSLGCDMNQLKPSLPHIPGGIQRNFRIPLRTGNQYGVRSVKDKAVARYLPLIPAVNIG